MKTFIFKVYNQDGKFLGVLNDVATDPAFDWSINSGLSELTFRLPRSIRSFGEGNIINYRNKVDVLVYDRDTELTVDTVQSFKWDGMKWDEGFWDEVGDFGWKLYSGFISKFTPSLDQSSEFVDVTCLGYGDELSRLMLEDSNGNTTIDYFSKDPSFIIRDIIEKQRSRGGTINFDSAEIDDTNYTVSYSFNTYLAKEALDKVIELSPNGWYYRVGGNNVLTFKQISASADHTFFFDRDIISIQAEKSTENMVNVIYFTGGDDASGQIFRKYERLSSVQTYGRYEQKYVDRRVTDNDTIDILCNAKLDRGETPEVRTRLVIRDNNNSEGIGYDIESIRPGETCNLTATENSASSLWDVMTWDEDKWDFDFASVLGQVQQIHRVSYRPNSVELEISSKLPLVSRRVEDIKRNLERQNTINNPTAPISY